MDISEVTADTLWILAREARTAIGQLHVDLLLKEDDQAVKKLKAHESVYVTVLRELERRKALHVW
jgi:hypothetical protein